MHVYLIENTKCCLLFFFLSYRVKSSLLIAGLFSSVLPKIQLFIKKDRKKEKGVWEKESQPLQMPHNCTEQMNINVTVKLE